ncbi:MAG: GTPase [Campylobacterota bacterium]|nr:GTPase [Campylobacterota bacterium]
MKIEKAQYLGIKDNVLLYSKEYMQSNEMEEFTQHIIEKVENFNPTIMVYGVYNAGKSTLLNALFGKEEMAKTGDSPETSTVNDYIYNGYTIYDTPGINAPQEHENITQAHRAKAEVILFVISNDGSFEDAYVYDKIAEIVKEKKPLLIVLNNKSGIDMNSHEANAEIDKVNFHLSTACDKKGIVKVEEIVSVVFVDAFTALEGKLENEDELIEESNINQLEIKIDELLGKSGNAEVSNALNLYITKYINQTIDIIDSEIDNPEMKRTQELITYLEKLKQKAEVELKNIAMESVVIITANLLELMLEKDKNSIEEMIEKSTKEVIERINQKFKQIHTELKSKIDEFKVDFEALVMESNDMDMTDNNIENTLMSNNTAGINTGQIGTAATIAIKGIPALAPMLPFVPIIGVVLAIFSVFTGSDEAKRHAEAQLDAKRQQHLSAKNRTDEFGINYKNDLILSIDTNLDKTFTNLIQNFINLASKLDGENSKLLQDKEKLQNILKNL